MLSTRTRAAKRRLKVLPRPARTRRTTLTLPADLLKKVGDVAVRRHQTLSSAVAYLVEAALRNEPESPRTSRGILELWRKSYLPLTEKERMLVDGIILDEPVTDPE
jgi:hypothetical protein